MELMEVLNYFQVTGGDSDGRDKARFEGSAEAPFAGRRRSCSGLHRSFKTDRLSGSLSPSTLSK